MNNDKNKELSKDEKKRKRKLKKLLKETNCRGKCGERSTKDVPWSTFQLRSVYINLGNKLGKEYSQHLKTGKSKRSFFCKKLRKDKSFCKELKKILPGEKVKYLRKLTTIKPISIDLPFDKYQERILRVYSRYMNNPQELVNRCKVYEISPYFDPELENEEDEELTPNFEDDPLEELSGRKKRELLKRLERARRERGKGEELEDGVKELVFSKNQEFVSNFIIPRNRVKGLLLNASVGTGKTCSAVLTASSQFENQGWSILWVTRTTLKSAMYKNIFEDVCHYRVLRRLQKGKKVPKTKEGKQKLIKKHWMEPVSYKTFSNAMKGIIKKTTNGSIELQGNKLFQSLVGRNGTRDILRKTLLIFDEAHNIFAGDLKPQEEPNAEYIRAGIHASYHISGNYSCKVLLLTATPIINSPTDLGRMVNLLLPNPEDRIPENMEDFKNKYIDPETKNFSKEGIKSFVSSTKGLISIYDKSKDPGQFTQVKKHKVVFPASKFELVGFNYKEELGKIKKEVKEKRKDCLVKVTKDKTKTKECRDNLIEYEKKKREEIKELKKRKKTDISQETVLKTNCFV